MRLNYFAYGSNMSSKRLLRRIPAERLGTAVLRGYRLRFTKPSELDGSAKCDICETSASDDVVYGVVYSIDESDKAILDDYEGLGFGYTDEMVTVAFNGEPLEVVTYMALNSRSDLKPFEWYRRHVLEGAVESGMPSDYISMIESVPALRDPDKSRRSLELSIYDQCHQR